MVACNTSVLSGKDGAVGYKPGNTTQCIAPADINVTTDVISVPGHGYVNGDAVKFVIPAGDTGPNIGGTPLTGTETFYVIAATPTTIQLSSTVGGAAAAITTAGTSTTHFQLTLANPYRMAQVQSWSGSLETEMLDTTVIGKGSYRRKQPNFSDFTGSLTIFFEKGASNTADSRLVKSILEGKLAADLTLYLDSETGSEKYIEAPVWLGSLSFEVSQDSTQSATVNFELRGAPSFVGF